MTKRNGPKCGCPTEHGPCELPAGWGTDHKGYGHCRKHLGNAPHHRTAARRIMAEDAARTFGLRIDGLTGEQALIDELALSRGTVEFYRAQVQALSTDQMTYGTERITLTQRPAGTNGQGRIEELTTVTKSQPNSWLKLLHEAERHHFAVAAECARLKLVERHVAVEEQQAATFHKLILVTLARFGIRPDDPRIGEIIPEVIRELTGG